MLARSGACDGHRDQRREGGCAGDQPAFLNAMFRHMPENASAITCGFAGDPNDDEGNANLNGSGKRGWPGTSTIHLRSDNNNYLAISSFYPDSETRRYRRRKALFAQMHGMMVDDIGTKVPKRKITLPLSALVDRPRREIFRAGTS